MNRPINIYDCYDVTKSYNHLLPTLAKLMKTSVSKISIVDHPCGEDTIFVGDKYRGYMDDDMMTTIDLFKEWESKSLQMPFEEYLCEWRSLIYS